MLVGGARTVEGHIIVCGDDPLGIRIIQQLRTVGREIAVVFSSAKLTDAGIGTAEGADPYRRR